MAASWGWDAGGSRWTRWDGLGRETARGPVLIEASGPAGKRPACTLRHAFDLHRATASDPPRRRRRFSFTATGHLVVYDAHGNKTVYSHHSWDRIESRCPRPTDAVSPA
jgi:hypothetical protein